MRHNNNKSRRYRHRSNGRGYKSHDNGDGQTRLRPALFLDGKVRNNFRSTQSAERLLEKYNTLAKEALSSGDKTLSENYFQHADHFLRIIGDRNKNQNQNTVEIINKPKTNDQNLAQNNNIVRVKPDEETKD